MRATEKTKIVSQFVPESVRLGQLIVETEQLLASTQTAVQQSLVDERTVLGEPAFDLARLAEVKAQHRTLDLTEHDLSTRLRLLEMQRWQAEQREAGERLREIATECERLVGIAAQAQAILDEAESAVLESLRAVVSVYVRHLELTREKTYLTSSYRLGLVAVPVLPELDPCPTLFAQMGEAMQPLLDLRLRAPVPKRQKPKSDGVFADA
jgi:hypothetical protein